MYILSKFLEYLVLQDYPYFEHLSICSEKDCSYFENVSLCSEKIAKKKKKKKKKKNGARIPETETRGVNT